VLPCDLCPINPPTPIIIANGDTEDIFGQDICGETFGWLRWTIAGSGFGVTSNPGLVLPFPCAGNFSAAFCWAVTPTQAFWLSTGPGPVELFIF
jgi:hypothetical protein